MSWVDKAHKKIRVEKEVDKILNNKKYKEELYRRDQQSVLKAIGWLSMMACEFLEVEHEYKEKEFKNFIYFIKTRIEETGNDAEYFTVVLSYYKSVYNIEIDKELGIDFGI